MAEPKTPTDEELANRNHEELDGEPDDDLTQAARAEQEAEQAELDKLLDDEQEDEVVDDTPPPAPVEDVDDPNDKPVSKRQERRVQDLLKKYGDPEVTPTADKRQDELDYNSLEADPDLIAKLNADREAASAEAYARGKRETDSVMFRTRLEIDAPKVESKYPILNPDSDEFDEAAAQDLNLMYLQVTGYDEKSGTARNGNIRYSDFTEVMVGLANRLADKKVTESTKQVKQQAANTGLRPDGSAPKSRKDPMEMTDEEFNKAFGLN